MREIFKGFYDVTPEEEKHIFESNKTIFVFDTNCFLNLYRCEEETKKDFMTVVDDIKDRLWFPFQVSFEYQRNRLKVISDSLKGLNEIKNSLGDVTKGIDIFCSGDKNIKNKYNILYDKLVDLKKTINDNVELFISENIETRIKEGDYISNSDDIRKWIDVISQGKVSHPFSQNEIDEINKEGTVRYKNKIGPGWRDEKDKGDNELYFNGTTYKDKFGDLYLWKEILKKSNEDGVDNIVFVTNDIKDDWWYRIHGKTIGSLEVLKTEITGNGLNNFKMYNQSTFVIKFIEVFKRIKVNEKSIKELEVLNNPKSYSDNINETLNTLNRLYKTSGLSHFLNDPTLKAARDFYSNPTFKAARDSYSKLGSAIELTDRYHSKKHMLEVRDKFQKETFPLQCRIDEIDESIFELQDEYLSLQGMLSADDEYDNHTDENGFFRELELIQFRIDELNAERSKLQRLINSM
ncbi:TPA: hypothetical protein SLN72_000163 [Morganella morganii]|nr:hypothetical protein [Morganella morganii]